MDIPSASAARRFRRGWTRARPIRWSPRARQPGGLTPLDSTATLHGYGSGAFQAHPAVIPVLQMGKAELHNVVVMVTADQNLFIPEIKLQINALLGYPVASALGRLTFSKDGTLTVSAQSPAPGQENGAALWVGDSFLLVGVNTIPVFEGGKVTGSTGPRLFALDTGSGSSYLTDRYLAEHKNVFTGPPSSMARLAGAGGGIHEIPAYTANHLPLWFGSTLVLSTGPHVLTQTQGGEVEAYYGLIGQDILQIFWWCPNLPRTGESGQRRRYRGRRTCIT
jgi:hypothetical protein